MKKYLFIILSFIYLIVTSGFTLNYHYCGGKLKKVSFVSNNEKGCCGNKMKSKGCCKDKHSFFKVKDNHKLGNSVNLSTNNFKIIDEALITTEVFKVSNQSFILQILNCYSPPVVVGKPLYIKNKVILI